MSNFATVLTMKMVSSCLFLIAIGATRPTKYSQLNSRFTWMVGNGSSLSELSSSPHAKLLIRCPRMTLSCKFPLGSIAFFKSEPVHNRYTTGYSSAMYVFIDSMVSCYISIHDWLLLTGLLSSIGILTRGVAQDRFFFQVIKNYYFPPYLEIASPPHDHPDHVPLISFSDVSGFW